jgi:serine/threonine/tyrosine-interacting protein
MEEDWNYQQRWMMQEIVPGVFLGPYTAARDKELLQQHNITHILCIKSKEEIYVRMFFPNDFHYRLLEAENSSFANLISMFPSTSEFISQAVSHGGRVLVHCLGGISRAPTIVIAFLMSNYQWDLETAYTVVQNKRFCMSPLDNFMGQLSVWFLLNQAYDAILKAKRETIGEDSKGLKRTIDDCDNPTLQDDNKRLIWD